MSIFTHSVKETTGLPCLGILKHGNYGSSDIPSVLANIWVKRNRGILKKKKKK